MRLRLFPATRFRVSGPNFIAEGARLASAGPLIGAAGRRRRRRRIGGRVGAPLRAGLALRVCYYVCCTHQRQGREAMTRLPNQGERRRRARSAPPVDRRHAHSARRLRRQRSRSRRKSALPTLKHGDCGRASISCSREHAARL